MILTIDTSAPLSEYDRRILDTLLGGPTVTFTSATVTPVADEPVAEAKPAPKKRASKKATPKAEVDPENEGIPSDAPTLKDAVDLASKLIAEGESDKVRTALAAVGATRVSGIAEDTVPAFLAALDAA